MDGYRLVTARLTIPQKRSGVYWLSSVQLMMLPSKLISRFHWQQPYEKLRQKWHMVPFEDKRISTTDLLNLPDDQLLDFWLNARKTSTTGAGFPARGWYHLIYKDVLRGKRVLDVGSGMGIDGITFAQNGAQVTFLDIVQTNLDVVKRVCKLLSVNEVDFRYLDDVHSLSALPANFDVLWCQGSLHHAPVEVIRPEIQELLKHLPIGGYWIQLAYSRSRWEKEGRMPFDRWGSRTDGQGTPWAEWYDWPKLKKILEPAAFDVVLDLEFHQGDFQWFHLVRKA